MSKPVRGLEHVQAKRSPVRGLARVRESFPLWGLGWDTPYPADFGHAAGGWPYGFGVRGYALDRVQRPDQLPAGILTEQDWLRHLALARDLYDHNPQANGILNQIVNFVGDLEVRFVRRGTTPGPIPLGDAPGDPAVEAVTDAWEEWQEKSGWMGGRQRECRLRAFRDGECWLRFFRGDHGEVPAARFGEPEQVRTPHGGSSDGEWGHGVRRDPDDPEEVLEYWFADPADRGQTGERVPADRVAHLPVNCDTGSKHGVSDFLPVRSLLDTSLKLLSNMGETTTALSRYLWITEHAPSTSGTMATSLIDSNKSYDALGANPFGAFGTPALTPFGVEQLRAPAVEEVSHGQKVSAVPNTHAEAFLSVSQGILRTVLSRWAAPEFMSGDGSNGNFSSSLVAGGPFVRAVEARQLEVAGFVRRVAEIVLRLCVESGRLPADAVRAVKVDVVPPSVVIVDQLAQAQRFQVLHGLGLDEPTILSECGYEPRQVAANKRAWSQLFPEDTPGGGPGGGGGGMLGQGAPPEPPGGGSTGGGNLMRDLLGESREPRTETGSDGLVYVAEAAGKKVLFTGRRTDKLGRARCYSQGKQVACSTLGDGHAAAGARENARRVLADPASATADDLRDLIDTLEGLSSAELETLRAEFGARMKGRLKPERVVALARWAREAAKGGGEPAPAPEPAAGGYGTAGADHPLAGKTRDEQVAHLGAAIARSEAGEDDVMGHESGPPAGLDLAAFSRDVAAAVAAHAAENGGVGMPTEAVYAAVGKKHGLTKQDFNRAVVAAHDAEAVRLGGWPGALDDLPDPELAPVVSARVMGTVRPGSRTADLAGDTPAPPAPPADPAAAQRAGVLAAVRARVQGQRDAMRAEIERSFPAAARMGLDAFAGSSAGTSQGFRDRLAQLRELDGRLADIDRELAGLRGTQTPAAEPPASPPLPPPAPPPLEQRGPALAHGTAQAREHLDDALAAVDAAGKSVPAGTVLRSASDALGLMQANIDQDEWGEAQAAAVDALNWLDAAKALAEKQLGRTQQDALGWGRTARDAQASEPHLAAALAAVERTIDRVGAVYADITKEIGSARPDAGRETARQAIDRLRKTPLPPPPPPTPAAVNSANSPNNPSTSVDNGAGVGDTPSVGPSSSAPSPGGSAMTASERPVIGWARVSGDTFAHKDAIRAAGGQWDSVNKVWSVPARQAGGVSSLPGVSVTHYQAKAVTPMPPLEGRHAADAEQARDRIVHAAERRAERDPAAAALVSKMAAVADSELWSQLSPVQEFPFIDDLASGEAGLERIKAHAARSPVGRAKLRFVRQVLS